MAYRHVHITATADRTLCGLLVTGRTNQHLPWSEWLNIYKGLPGMCCPTCRRLAWNSGDRAKAIRSADQERLLRSPDERE